jgi:hypothetical protein
MGSSIVVKIFCVVCVERAAYRLNLVTLYETRYIYLISYAGINGSSGA